MASPVHCALLFRPLPSFENFFPQKVEKSGEKCYIIA